MITRKSIILFDGVCNLCNNSVNFIIKRDRKDIFRFMPSQSKEGIELGNKLGIEYSPTETVILIENDKVFTKSTGAIRIACKLGGLWSLALLVYVIPKFLRDPIYIIIAKNRYKWFGIRDTCMTPSPELIDKFITH